MSVAEQNISFDDVLDAVKESKRGRWFLDEYEGRLRKSDTAELRAAISKLESVMTSMSGSGADAALLARAKSAILAARKDIAALDDKPQGLSEEGRLFARLADLARQSFETNGNEAPSAVNVGVVRALRLVDELETDLCGPVDHVAEIRPATYFHQHSDVFEAPKPALVAVKSVALTPSIKKPEGEVVRGAKLVIQRAPARATETATPVAEDLPAPIVAEAPPEPAAQRVVVRAADTPLCPSAI